MSLTQCLDQYKMIPNYIKNSILLDVSLGLLYLHKQTPPIVHRDLTTNNVLLTSGLKAKISHVPLYILTDLFYEDNVALTKARRRKYLFDQIRVQ